jgi:hypothetical protein
MGSQEPFAAFKQGGVELGCSGGFGWGYSEKVPDATGSDAGVELAVYSINRGGVGSAEQRGNRFQRTYLKPNSQTMQQRGRGVGRHRNSEGARTYLEPNRNTMQKPIGGRGRQNHRDPSEIKKQVGCGLNLETAGLKTSPATVNIGRLIL